MRLSRKIRQPIGVAVAAAMIVPAAGAAAAQMYRWPHAQNGAATLKQMIAPPDGFQRIPAGKGTFAHWLRGLPMKPAGTKVMLHSGREKWRQDIHAAVIDIDTGKRDLQQCADAVMRLRAEWLLASGSPKAIAFNDTGSGKPMSYARWAKGERPRLSGKRLTWSRRARPDTGYRSFRRYMNLVFAYAGTYSLAKELGPVARTDIAIGDVFIKGGFPGHAVLVADMVQNPGTGEKRFALVQSYMPAQDMHVLRQPSLLGGGSPWFALGSSGPLITPEWVFPPGSLKRWR